ncbi:TetR/AcrR family transcriptional regulator [Nocardiopsis kunsanensis]|uniref:TetR family transcriptional regulator n=1 Tax=Nocardiopsis kunsanensis TaxID=141693 RepID=A0A918XAZ5_9ACTN|nr:TetR family transcriptional regulator [Nocardiopsis kunsanensis]GHD20685.1 TetR family transcriptional regulator [Nocardiopsis kunsanensis]
MSASDSRGTILSTARELFSEHGYTAVTIRDIAAAAGVSPSLVMKHYRSKAELFNELGPNDIPLAELDLPRSELGRALVQKVLNRREHGLSDPLLVAVSHARESPEPERTRAEFRERLLYRFGELIGDTTPDRRHASAVASQILGLAEGVRVLGLFPAEEISREELLDLYGPLVQQQIDACTETQGPGPDS